MAQKEDGKGLQKVEQGGKRGLFKSAKSGKKWTVNKRKEQQKRNTDTIPPREDGERAYSKERLQIKSLKG